MAQKQNNIEQMDTLQIVTHLIYRHRTVLLIAFSICSNLAWFITTFSK